LARYIDIRTGPAINVRPAKYASADEKALFTEIAPKHKCTVPVHAGRARLPASAPAVATFVDFLTLFGSAQQVLKNRMQAASEQKLGPLHMRVLTLCLSTPGCTQQHIVQTMGRDKGQVARLARDLEEHQLIVRAQDEDDRRVWRLTLTLAGQAKCDWFAAIETGLATQMFGSLGANERVSLDALIKDVSQRIESDLDDL
jgi:DNA-binding MarR family transcriptional regulator